MRGRSSSTRGCRAERNEGKGVEGARRRDGSDVARAAHEGQRGAAVEGGGGGAVRGDAVRGASGLVLRVVVVVGGGADAVDGLDGGGLGVSGVVPFDRFVLLCSARGSEGEEGEGGTYSWEGLPGWRGRHGVCGGGGALDERGVVGVDVCRLDVDQALRVLCRRTEALA